jgi:chorismate dehydratase
MSQVRLGAVEYLNARPLVYGLDRLERFTLRFDVPSRCAALLHEGVIDVGLIPSIEYLRAPAKAGPSVSSDYAIVPGMAISSRGPVRSVAIYTTRDISDVQSLALDTSSRSSVALARVLCARAFHIQPTFQDHAPDLQAMLAVADAALVIGDMALFLDLGELEIGGRRQTIKKIDLGEVWTKLTGLPFVYAFWAGRQMALTGHDVDLLRQAAEEGVGRLASIAADYFPGSSEHQLVGARYLRDNIKYEFGANERAGLELFYRYAAEARVVDGVAPLRFY